MKEGKALKLLILIGIPVIVLAILVLLTSGIDLNFKFIKAQEVSLGEFTSLEDIKKYEGKEIKLVGFISPMSPYGEKYVYVSDTPYNSDVFAKDEDGNQKEFNAIAVHDKDNNKVEFTNFPVVVEGKIELGDFEDENGGVYSYRMVNATITEIDENELTESLTEYYKLQQKEFFGSLNQQLNNIDTCIYIDDLEEAGYYKKEQLTALDTTVFDNLLTVLQECGIENEAPKNAIEQLKEIAVKANEYIENKEYDKLKDLEENFNNAYYIFNEWVIGYKA